MSTFPELATTLLADLQLLNPEMSLHEAQRRILKMVYAPDIQNRFARIFAHRDKREFLRFVMIAISEGEKGIVRAWFADDNTLRVEPILDDMTQATRFISPLSPSMCGEHFEDAANAAIDMLVDFFDARPDSQIDIVAPLAAAFDENAFMALATRMAKMAERMQQEIS